MNQSFNEFLFSQLQIKPEEKEKILAKIEQTKLPLITVLKNAGIVEEKQLIELVAKYFGLPLLERKHYPREPLFLEEVSVAFFKKYHILPIKRTKEEITVAISNPFNLSLLTTIKQFFYPLRVKFSLGLTTDIDEAIDRLYGERDIEETIEEAESEILDWEEESLRDMALEAPIVRLVNMIITKAVEMRASDIHFEPFEKEFKVRYRIDGILHEVETPPKRLQPAIISRIKLIAGMNIAERRLPQDGRIKLRLGGQEIDIRVSTVPTIFGESVVLRLLYPEGREFRLDTLGLGFREFHLVQEKIYYPHGIILVTGPTGSGKTTTLYAILKEIKSPEKKIITVEDPVEYQIEGINQIQVRPELELNFANILRSIVRQDPDVLLIGEIRDKETAEIAIQSALTGHLVFSTLHTNDAATAITRLIDLGVEPYLISASLLLIVAQRLVRVLCSCCKVAFEPEKVLINKMMSYFPPQLQTQIDWKNLILYRSSGCEECGYTGYKGRIGVFEVMEISERIRSLIIEGADADTVRQRAIVEGMATMTVDGLKKVIGGTTTLEEVLRVTRS